MISNAKTAITQLVKSRLGLQNDAVVIKGKIADVDKQICEIIQPEALLKEKDKEYGEVTKVIDGGKFTVGSDKTVKWDSDKLMDLAATMDWKIAVSMFKITFEMTETKYKALIDNVKSGFVPQAMLDAVNAARAEKIGEVKLKKAELEEEKK